MCTLLVCVYSILMARALIVAVLFVSGIHIYQCRASCYCSPLLRSLRINVYYGYIRLQPICTSIIPRVLYYQVSALLLTVEYILYQTRALLCSCLQRTMLIAFAYRIAIFIKEVSCIRLCIQALLYGLQGYVLKQFYCSLIIYWLLFIA